MSSVSRSMTCLLFLLLAGCDFQSYHYDASGRLLYPDGEPATRVTVVLDGPFPSDTSSPHDSSDFERRMPSEYVKSFKTETDNAGRFNARFVAGPLYSTLGASPPAPELPEVYIWVNDRGQWRPTTVTLDRQMQKQAYPGRRHIDLPDVTLPFSQTQPDTHPTTQTIDIDEYIVEPATRPATRPATSRPSILLRDSFLP